MPRIEAFRGTFVAVSSRCEHLDSENQAINYLKTWMIVDVITLTPDWAFTVVRLINPSLEGSADLYCIPQVSNYVCLKKKKKKKQKSLQYLLYIPF